MMPAKNLMILGTASGVGKSVITAGFCRIFSDAGYRTAPFKAQNMSNNSFVTEEGAEMGRAQVVQAECARTRPHVDMNPVLLKPASEDGSQVIVHGKAWGHWKERPYFRDREKFFAAIQSSYERLDQTYEMLVIEGAGSPVEVNLKAYDMVNLRTAEMANAPCLLVADIDRGGVFASLIGTLDLMEDHERERIRGMIINKFRGDLTLFKDGVDFLERRTGKKVLGVLPFDRKLWVPEEDSVTLQKSQNHSTSSLDIAVIYLPRISNFTDFEPLQFHSGVQVRYVSQPKEMGFPDLLILPGTKATVADYGYLKENGFEAPIRDFVEHGGNLLGICGGFQMMGTKIVDPDQVESGIPEIEGLGLFNMKTEFTPEKIVGREQYEISCRLFGYPVQGKVDIYEIHMGQSQYQSSYQPLGHHGIIGMQERILGTYAHGLFEHSDFRTSFIEALAQSRGKSVSRPERSFEEIKQAHYNHLAELMKNHLDLQEIEKIVGLKLNENIGSRM